MPRVKRVQKNVKVFIKEEDCPEEYATDVASIIYFSGIYGMQSFERVKNQFAFKYGQKFVDRIITKHKGVDEEIYSNLNYKVPKDELKDRTKDLSSISKKRVKEEAKMIQDSNAALAEGIRNIPSAIASRGADSTPSKRRDDSSSDEEYSEYSESSEEEKPKKKSKKASKKAKKAKKDTSSEESSESESESSEEEKPKKKSKKADKVKVAEETDSDEPLPAAVPAVPAPAAKPAAESTPATETVSETAPKEAAPAADVAKEEVRQ